MYVSEYDLYILTRLEDLYGLVSISGLDGLVSRLLDKINRMQSH